MVDFAESRSESVMPEIFAYTDYRKFLSDLYTAHKQTNRAFSYRYIAQKAGIASPSFIGKIFSGESNISHQTLMRLVDVFQLAGPEAEYFELMVNFDRSRTELDKSHYFQRMRALRNRYGQSHGDAADAVHSAWYVAPILTLLELGLFRGDYAALGRMLTPTISAQESRSAVESLMLDGLVHKGAGGSVFLAMRAEPRPPPSEHPMDCEPSSFGLENVDDLVLALPTTTPEDLRRRIMNMHEELRRLLRLAHGR